MNDDLYDIDDIEQMLSPRCEFHASERLKPSVMDRAKALSRHRKLWFIPWLAAACVGGILIMIAANIRHNDEIPAEPILAVAITPESVHTVRAIPTPSNKVKEELLSTPTPRNSPRKATPATAKQISRNDTLVILSETDIPITNPENLIYSPEEIAQIKRQEQEEYLSRLRLMVEIAEHMTAENFKIL